MAALRRRGKANCTDKADSEVSIADYLEHAAKSKIMAEHPEFDDLETASFETKQRFETLVSANRNALNETWSEECMSQEVPEGIVIDVDDKGPNQPPSWVNMRYEVSTWSDLEQAL